MRQRDWFIVGVRLLGVYILTLAAWDFLTLLNLALGWFAPVKTPHQVYVLDTIAHLVVGAFLLLFAEGLAWFAYRLPKPARRCQHCGYDLRGNTSGICPECGTAAAPPVAPAITLPPFRPGQAAHPTTSPNPKKNQEG